MITSLKQLAVAQDAGSTFGGAGSQNGHEAGTDAVGGGGSSGEFGGTLQETTGTGLCCGRADVCLCLCPEQPSCGDRQRSEVHTSASSERSDRSNRSYTRWRSTTTSRPARSSACGQCCSGERCPSARCNIDVGAPWKLRRYFKKIVL